MKSWQRTVMTVIVGASLLACSGGKRHTPGTHDPSVPVPNVGDPVDLDGDGKPDGVAVDSDGDGIADGVDTNNDGKADAPLPSGGTDGSGQAGDGDGDGDMSVMDGGASDPNVWIDGGAAPYPVNDQGQVLCGDAPCACSDGMDNDNDKLTDLQDPECVSSWDNDESSFATGISGDNRDDACQDCFFDGNSGSGNDGCRLPSSCLSEGNASTGRGSCSTCEQSDQCVNFCKAFTPNGCDCFGCCTVRLANDTTVNVALSTGCQIDGNTVGDGCTECVPNDSCINTCGRCELCPGKTIEDLPADCFTSGDGDGDGDAGTGGDGDGDGDGDGTGSTPTPACDDGAQVCSSTKPCETGYSCDFGCCVRLPVVL
jgi:hypothetical protein